MTIKIYITTRLYFYHTFFMKLFDNLNIKYEFVDNYDNDVDIVILWNNKLFTKIPKLYDKFIHNHTIMNKIDNNIFSMDKSILTKYNFCPYSFSIQFNDLKYDKKLMKKYLNQYKYNHNFGKDYWILKHDQSSLGVGTLIVKTDELFNLDTNSRFLDEISNFNYKKMTYVIQKYLEKPAIIDNRKYDIRAHFVIFSKIDKHNNIIYKFYLYNILVARITKTNFDIDNTDKKVHLTNNAVQINHNFYNLKDFVNINDFNKIYNNIYLQLKELLSSEYFIKMINKINKYPYFYNLFGVDFILDKDYNTYIVDFNTSPALHLTGLQSLYQRKEFNEIHLMNCIYFKIIRLYNKYKKFIKKDNIDKFNKLKTDYSIKNNFKFLYKISLTK